MSSDQIGSKNTSSKTYEQKVSYGFGWQFGRQLHKNRFEGLDLEECIRALKQCFNGQASDFSEIELNEAYDAVKAKKQSHDKQRMENYKGLCGDFLVQNAKREGVLQTKSGLQYEILEEGAGAKPKQASTVVVHYHGTFIDGQVFDSSVSRNEPAEFSLDQVIPGWTEALLLMNTGAKWRIAVPYSLAYGEQGQPPVIPSYATLMFEIHLIDILK